MREGGAPQPQTKGLHCHNLHGFWVNFSHSTILAEVFTKQFPDETISFVVLLIVSTKPNADVCSSHLESSKKAPPQRATLNVAWISLEFSEFCWISLEIYWNFTSLPVPFGRVPFGCCQVTQHLDSCNYVIPLTTTRGPCPGRIQSGWGMLQPSPQGGECKSALRAASTKQVKQASISTSCLQLIHVRILLGRDCLRALFSKQFPRPVKWVKKGFCRSPEVILKWVQSGFGAFWPTFGPKNPRFLPTFGPISGDWQKPHLKPTLRDDKLFCKKGPEATLTQHSVRNSSGKQKQGSGVRERLRKESGPWLMNSHF